MATDYQDFVKRFFKDHPGTTMKKAAEAWNRKEHPAAKRRRPSESCASTVVPTADGAGVTTRQGMHLRASFEAHTEVKFDQAALGAVWAGIITGLRQNGGANLAALFPDLYPDANAAMRANRSHADERAIGIQLAPLLGAVLIAYRVTPEEFAGWYAAAAQEQYIVPAERGTCAIITAAIGSSNMPQTIQGLPAQAGGPGQWGGVLGAPGGAVNGASGGVLPGGRFGVAR